MVVFKLFSFVYSLPGSSVWKELWDNHVGKRCVRLWENFEGSLKEPWENLERKPRENSERTLIEHCDRTWTDSLSLFLSFSLSLTHFWLMSSHATNFMYTNYFDALCAVVLSNRERVRVRFGVRVGYFESESMHESLTVHKTLVGTSQYILVLLWENFERGWTCVEGKCPKVLGLKTFKMVACWLSKWTSTTLSWLGHTLMVA